MIPINEGKIQVEWCRRNGIRKTDLYVDWDSDEFSLTPAKKSPTNMLRVRQYTVPEILATLGWDNVDILKIDIEGYEKTLFRADNEWLSRMRLIIGEARGHVGYGISEVRADGLRGYPEKLKHGVRFNDIRGAQ